MNQTQKSWTPPTKRWSFVDPHSSCVPLNPRSRDDHGRGVEIGGRKEGLQTRSGLTLEGPLWTTAPKSPEVGRPVSRYGPRTRVRGVVGGDGGRHRPLFTGGPKVWTPVLSPVPRVLIPTNEAGSGGRGYGSLFPIVHTSSPHPSPTPTFRGPDFPQDTRQPDPRPTLQVRVTDVGDTFGSTERGLPRTWVLLTVVNVTKHRLTFHKGGLFGLPFREDKEIRTPNSSLRTQPTQGRTRGGDPGEHVLRWTCCHTCRGDLDRKYVEPGEVPGGRTEEREWTSRKSSQSTGGGRTGEKG